MQTRLPFDLHNAHFFIMFFAIVVFMLLWCLLERKHLIDLTEQSYLKLPTLGFHEE